MNLDGFDDLIVAREGRLEVYSRGTDLSAEWQLMMASPDSEVSITEFLLADIDRDYDKAISDIKAPVLLRDADGDRKIVTDPSGKNRWLRHGSRCDRVERRGSRHPAQRRR